MDECGINNTSFKQNQYSKKGQKKILHGRARVKCRSLLLTVSMEGHELHQFIEGGLNQFNFIEYMKALKHKLVEIKKIPLEQIVVFLDNCPAHDSYYTRYNLNNLGMKCIFNIKCTPAFNIIETVFADMKFSIRRANIK